jgi:hypothetical protein
LLVDAGHLCDRMRAMAYGEALESLLVAQQDCAGIAASDNPNTPVDIKRQSTALLKVLPIAVPFWWNVDTASAVLLASKDYPDLPLSRSLLYCDCGWSYFQQPLLSFKLDTIPGTTSIRSLLSHARRTPKPSDTQNNQTRTRQHRSSQHSSSSTPAYRLRLTRFRLRE